LGRILEFDAEPRMIGRERELEELKRHLDRAAEGQGSTVLISGEAGIGKTRLVQELRQIAEAQGFQILLGYSLHESLTPYMPFLDALRSGGLEPLFAEEAPKVEAVYLVTHGGILIKEVLREKTELDPVLFASMLTAVGNFVLDSMSKLSGEEREGTLSGLSMSGYQILIEAGRDANLVAVISGEKNEFLVEDMRRVLGDMRKAYGNALENWDGDEKSVEGIEELLRPLIMSGKYDGLYYGKEDPKARRNLLFENVSLGLVRHSQTTPTLLCLEDLQWADPSSLSLMHYVARNAGDCGILMLGTYRPEDVAAEDGRGHPLTDTMHLMDREDLHQCLELDRLPADKMADFMRALLGEVDFDDAFMVRVHEETEGNPLFVIQLVKLLVEENIVAREKGSWRLAKSIEEIDIPSKTYNVILHRLNRIEKEPRKVLDYASVIGDVFTSNTLAAALDLKRILLLEHLKVLEQTHRMIHPHDGGYRFDHAKVRETLYGEIPQELRDEYHAVIAQSIERLNEDDLDSVIEDLAFHYYHCRDGEKALQYLTRAAEKAKKEYSNEEAVRFYTEALELEEDRPKRREMLVALGDIYLLTGEYDRGLESYEKALEFAEEDRAKAGIKAKIGTIHLKRGEYDESVRISTEARGLVRDKECKEEAHSLRNICAVYTYRGEYDKALESYEKCLRMQERIDDREGLAIALGNIGVVHADMGEPDRALEFYEKSLREEEKIGNQEGIAATLNNIGLVLFETGELDRALEFYEKSLWTKEKIGDQGGIPASLGNIGNLHLKKGELDRALEFYEKSLRITEKTGDRRYIAWCLMNIGMVQSERGELDRALETYERGLGIVAKLGDRALIAATLNNIGEVHHRRGEYKRAQEIYEKSLRIAEEIGHQYLVAWSLSTLGELHSDIKELGKALEFHNKGLEVARTIGHKEEIARALIGTSRAETNRNELKKALDFCNEAYSLSTELGIERLEAESRCVLGVIYREQSKWEESIENFERTIEILEGIECKHKLAESYFEFGSMWSKKGDIDEASSYLNKALETFEKLQMNHRVREGEEAIEALRE
jgi:tetratricopeptide (TPR) repeat protein/predicted regulator of Ras-like GTPase activity (Roadblock/LC7/MglB family)